MESLSHEERFKGSGVFSAGKQRLRGHGLLSIKTSEGKHWRRAIDAKGQH